MLLYFDILGWGADFVVRVCRGGSNATAPDGKVQEAARRILEKKNLIFCAQ
jgi:hypothetical protein